MGGVHNWMTPEGEKENGEEMEKGKLGLIPNL